MVEIKLCSEFEPQTKLVCDLPKGHRGPHRATMLWGDEKYFDPGFSDLRDTRLIEEDDR